MSISLNPADAIEGGLLDDVNVEITSAKFEMFDYGGKAAATPALKLDMTVEGVEVDGQYWSVGNSQDWAPTKNGKGLDAIGGQTQLRAGSNFMLFVTELINAGFPADKIGEDITVLDGMECHVKRIPAPKRGGLSNVKKGPDGKEYEATVLVVDEVIRLPWEKKAGKGAPAKKKSAAKGKAKGKGKAAVAEAKVEGDAGADTGTDSGAAEGGVEERAIEFVMGALAAHPDGIAKKDLPTMVFQELKTDPDRNKIVQLIYKDEFLADGPWVYADGQVSLG